MPNSTSVVRENYRTLDHFYEHWGGREKFEEFGMGHRREVLVTYRYAQRVIRQVTTATLTFSGYRTEATIELEPRGALSVNKQHLGFSADFQRYRFDENSGALIVSDTSAKMKGPYSVEIVPLEAVGEAG